MVEKEREREREREGVCDASLRRNSTTRRANGQRRAASFALPCPARRRRQWRRRLTFRSVVVVVAARVSVFHSRADIDPTAWRCCPVITLYAVSLHVADEVLRTRFSSMRDRRPWVVAKNYASRFPNGPARARAIGTNSVNGREQNSSAKWRGSSNVVGAVRWNYTGWFKFFSIELLALSIRLHLSQRPLCHRWTDTLWVRENKTTTTK